jgi:hypothetical protein
VFLRFGPDDAGHQRATRNQDVVQKAQLRNTSIPGPANPVPTPFVAIIE